MSKEVPVVEPCCCLTAVPPPISCVAPCNLVVSRDKLFKRKLEFESSLVFTEAENSKDHKIWKTRAFHPSVENVELICAVLYTMLYQCTGSEQKEIYSTSTYIMDAQYTKSPNKNGDASADITFCFVPNRKQMMWEYLMLLITQFDFAELLKVTLQTTNYEFVYRTVISLLLGLYPSQNQCESQIICL